MVVVVGVVDVYVDVVVWCLLGGDVVEYMGVVFVFWS